MGNFFFAFDLKISFSQIYCLMRYISISMLSSSNNFAKLFHYRIRDLLSSSFQITFFSIILKLTDKDHWTLKKKPHNIYLFLSVLSLQCSVKTFFPVAVVSFCCEAQSAHTGFSSCGSWTWWLCSMWAVSDQRLNPYCIGRQILFNH